MESQKGSETMGIRVKDPADFKLRLVKSGFTQTEFAKNIGLSLPFFNRVINGERKVGVKAAGKIHKELKSKFDELFVIEAE